MKSAQNNQRPKWVHALDELDINEVLAQLAIEDSLAYGFGQLSLNAKSGTDAGNAMKVRALVDYAPL